MAFPVFLVATLAAQAIQAGIQGSKAKKNIAESNRLDSQIPLNDPVQQAFLSKIQRQERHYRAGTDPNSVLSNQLASQAGAQAQTNLVRAGGPGIVQNILSSQGVTQRGMAQTGAMAAQRADQMIGMEGQLTGMMAERRYDRQRYRRDLALMRGVQHQQNANNMIANTMSMLPDVTGGFGGGTKSTSGGPGSFGGGGGFGNAWRTQGTGGSIPAAPTQAPQYTMLSGSVQEPTSAYDMGQQVNI